MIGGRELYRHYGDPNTQPNMIMWEVPAELRQGAIPRRIYCNKDMVPRLVRAFSNLITTGHITELKTWDGCYNIRPIRGYEKAYENLMNARKIEDAIDLLSVHSWGCAVDVNLATNRLGQPPTLTPGFVRCWTDAGFEWGGSWPRKDGMHFQLRDLPTSLS